MSCSCRSRPRDPTARVSITPHCVKGIGEALSDSAMRRHEGIVYLLGTTDGRATRVISCVAPDATTTWGSFVVSAPAMARVVRAAANSRLAVVGQIHTHPGRACHSLGDFRGMRIRYPGYVSFVLPAYGRRFPDVAGAELLMCEAPFRFIRVDVQSQLHIDGGDA